MIIKIISYQVYRGLNLWGPKPGVRITFQIVSDTDLLQVGMIQKFEKSLAELGEKNNLEGSADSVAVPAMANFICHFSLALQRKAGSDVGFFSVIQSSKDNEWNLFVEFEFEHTGRQAINSVIKFLNALNDDVTNFAVKLPALIEKLIEPLQKSYDSRVFHVANRAYTSIANERGIPNRRLFDHETYLQIGYGRSQKLFRRFVPPEETQISVRIATNKQEATACLRAAGLPVADQIAVQTLQQARAAAEKIGFPVVVKPLSGGQGIGITPNIQNSDDLSNAMEFARPHGNHILIEKHIDGDDYRIVVIDGKYGGCIRRSISQVTGDGISTVDELCQVLNRQPWRSEAEGMDKYLVRKIDVVTDYLRQQGVDWDSVLDKGVTIKLHIVPNLSQGGTLEDATDIIHSENIKMAIRSAACMGLKVAGIDYLTTDITRPYWETGGGICEINSNPGFDVMFSDKDGDALWLYRKVFDLSFPPGENNFASAIVVFGDSLGSAQNLIGGLSKGNLVISHSARGKATIDGSPLMVAQTGLAACHAALWNGYADAIIIEENAQDIERYGLGYEIVDFLIIEEMPKLQDHSAPQILDLLAGPVSKVVIINAADRELTHWASTKADLNIVSVEKKNEISIGAALANQVLSVF